MHCQITIESQITNISDKWPRNTQSDLNEQTTKGRNMNILKYAFLILILLSGCSQKSTIENEPSNTQVQYQYDFINPLPIKSSAPSGKFQIAELDTSFPSQMNDIQTWLSQEIDNNAAVRSHSWSIWGSLTSLTPYSIENPYNAQIGSSHLPTFMTWYSSYEVYGVNSNAKNSCASGRQGTIDKHGIKRCRAGSLLDFNKYSLVESKYVIDQQYNNLSTLTQRVNNNPEPLDLPPFNNSLFANNTADNVSFSLKPVYYLLKNNAHNLLPYWGGMQPNTTVTPNAPTPNTWNQCVAITVGTTSSSLPKVCNPGKGNANATAPDGGWQQVALSDFLAIPLTQEMLDELNYAQKSSPLQASSILSLGYSDDAKAEVGDVAVLVGMHVTVRESKNWVWQTMYWSPKDLQQVTMNTDYPVFPPKSDTYNAGENYPASSFDNPYQTPSPAHTNIPSWAKNYAMCTAYSPVYPIQPDTGGTNDSTFPQICFNPWLETAFDTLKGHFSNTGLNSNCMSCHAQASYNGSVAPGMQTAKCSEPQGFGYYGNGYTSRDNSCLTNKNFAYDFSWHISNAYDDEKSKSVNKEVIHQKPPIIAPSFNR